MQHRHHFSLGCLVAALASLAPAAAAQSAGRGTITGHVKLIGTLPGNPVIRMGRDPMCAQVNRGKRVVQETVAAALDGSLANVFVTLEGTFPDTPIPAEPVTIDQRGCMYTPRVVGVRVGQVLQIKNDDDLLHNVHSLSARTNSFNVGQPIAGMVNRFRLKDEETMLRLSCDLHTWMKAYIGIVSHPYFAVTGAAGTFEIANVPVGSHTLVVWQEAYGQRKQRIAVKAGGPTNVELTFSTTDKPPA
jgi:hypothetical protein